ncbi:MAG: MerR family transcriptional regulator [Bacteroidetes bacterium]|nr:MAG: MerR family transcriptional regulator [Bacteroidota bacterium]
MPYKQKEIEKKYYTIGEVAEKFGVATSLVRFWETEFDSIKPTKNKKGNRVYTKEDIEDISIVYHYVKEKGYTLNGAKELIKIDRTKNLEKIEAINSLEKVRDFLLELKTSLG